MKRIALGLLLGIACLLSACGGSSNTAASKISLTYIVGQTSDPFYTPMACGATAEGKKLGVDVTIQGPTSWGVSNETPIVNAVVSAHPSAMVVVPNDSKAMIPPIQAAANAGIKVVLADTTLDDTSFVVSQVSSDNVALGVASADALANLVGKQGKVFVLGVNPGVSTIDGRYQGFKQEMAAKYPNITVTDALIGGTSSNQTAAIVSAEISKYPDTVGIMTTADGVATDAISALKQADLVGKVKIVSFDASPEEVQQLQSNQVQALIAQKPYDIGVNAVDQAVAAVKGQSTTKVVATGAVIITAQNLTDATTQAALYKLSC